MLDGTEAWTEVDSAYVTAALQKRQQLYLLLTLGCFEVNDVAILLKHVHLFDLLYRLHIQLLKRLLQLTIVCAGTLRRPLDLATGRTLSSAHVSVPT